MNKLPEAAPPSANAPRETGRLAFVCQLLGCLLLAGWAAWRVKPVFWFGPLFGGIFGVLSLMIWQWLPARSPRMALILTALLSGCGVAIAFGMTAVRAHAAAAAASPRDQLAGSLMAALERSTKAGEVPPEFSTSQSSVQPSLLTQITTWIEHRYRPYPVAGGWLAGLEVFLAGLAGTMVVWCGQRIANKANPMHLSTDSTELTP